MLARTLSLLALICLLTSTPAGSNGTGLDFGDAPDPTYATTLASSGPRHTLGSGLFLGASVDAEADGQPDLTATGDDLLGTAPDDEDGLATTPVLVPGRGATITVTASIPGQLDCWIDFDGNGAFDHPAEHLAAGASIALAAGPNPIAFTVPGAALPGPTFLRLRVSAAGGLPPTGHAPDGEVEDHQVEILLTGSIHGFKFEDVDGDGTYTDTVDLPLAGVEVNLTGTDLLGNVIDAFTNTDIHGEFGFTDLVPSIDGLGPATGYTVTETMPAGFVATTPTSFSSDLLSGQELVAFPGQADLPPGDPRVEALVGAPLMFGNTVPGSIHGFKFRDLDEDGLYDDMVDLPLAGVDFTLTGTDGQGNVINLTDTTDANGEISFTGLLPSVNGSGPATGYTVTETVPGGSAPTTAISYSSDLRSRQELVAFQGQAILPAATSATIDFDDVDAGGGGLTVLGYVDYDPLSPNPANLVGTEMDVDPLNRYVYMAAGFGSGSKIIRFDVSDPASIPTFTHVSPGWGSGVAVDPVTGRYAATNGFGAQLRVFHANTAVFDTESLIGCGGSVAAGSGTFGVSTQCSDDFFVYDQSSMTISGSLDSTAVGATVAYNPGSGRYYKMRIPGPAPFWAHETALLADSGVLGASATAVVTAADGAMNRIYLHDAGTISALDGTTHAAIGGFTAITGLTVTGSSAVDTNRNRLYIPTSSGIRIHDASTGAALSDLALGGGFVPRHLVMEQGDDYLYVRASDASNNQRLLVLAATGGGGPITGVALDGYLEELGITITGITPSGLPEIVDDRVGFPSQVLRAFSDFNVLWHDSPNDPYAYTVRFAVPQADFSFVRPELFGATPSGLIVSPWRARAFDAAGALLDTVSEPQLAFFGSTPAVSFTLDGPGITAVIFDRTTPNTIAGLNRVPTDDWQLDVPTDPRREVLVGLPLMFGNSLGRDFGDAPDPTYATLTASGGPSHALGGGLVLGSFADAEPDGQPDATATGDDLAAIADEDGLLAATPLVAGRSASITVATSAPGLLDAWIDFDASGTFDHPAEHLASGVSVAVTPGGYLVPFTVPAAALPGATFLRLRLSSAGFLPPTGFALDGEVEDHQLEVLIPGSIHGFDFEDVDGDGVYSELVDLPLAGVQVTLTGTDVRGVPVDVQTTTDVHGRFAFTELSPSVSGVGPATGYTVTETLPAGFGHTTSKLFVSDLHSGQELVAFAGQADLPPGDPRVEVLIGDPLMFGNAVPASIHGFKFEDANANGIYDEAIDSAMAGVEFKLTGTDGVGNVIDVFDLTATSDADGYFSFGGLLPSVDGLGPATGYTVTETVPLDSVPTTPSFFTTDLLSRQELVAFAGQAELPDGTPATVDFDDLEAGDGPITGPALRAYLNGLGVTVFGIVPSGDVEVVDDRFGFPSQVLRAYSDYNVFWHDSPNDPYTYELRFAAPQDDFTFVRPELFGATPSGLIVSPWRARAFDATGALLDTVSEPQLAFFGSTPAVSFTLDGPGIASVIFDRTTLNTIAGLNRVPSDDWQLVVPTDPRREVVLGTDLMFGNGLSNDFGDAPDPTYPTLAASDGARHLVPPSPLLYLGGTVDTEPDGQPHPAATGDGSDEDGVAFTSYLRVNVLPTMAQVTVTASAPGILNGWIDFGQDGDWADPGEQVFLDQPLAAGANALAFPVPPRAQFGSTYARFRLDSGGGLSYDGPAVDGEVEDYTATVVPDDDLELFNMVLFEDRTFVACNSITAGGDFTPTPDLVIVPSADIVFRAANLVIWRNGLAVEEGASLSVLVGNVPECP